MREKPGPHRASDSTSAATRTDEKAALRLAIFADLPPYVRSGPRGPRGPGAGARTSGTMAAAGSPVVRQAIGDAGGVSTSVTLVLYSNRYLVIATQTGRPGTWLSVIPPAVVGGQHSSASLADVRTVLGPRGADMGVHEVFARRVHDALVSHGLAPLPLLLSLAVEKLTKSVLDGVVALVADVAGGDGGGGGMGDV